MGLVVIEPILEPRASKTSKNDLDKCVVTTLRDFTHFKFMR
jgi:hypothetical protein